MATKDGLRLIIELSPEEANVFRRIAKTNDRSFYEGIAKALVLGATEVVDPTQVQQDIQLLLEVHEFGALGGIPAKQSWADELSFTVQQLESASVMNAIGEWSRYFRQDIKWVAASRRISLADQVRWTGLNARVSALLEILRETIRVHL